MKKFLLVMIFAVCNTVIFAQNGFLSGQQQYKRVRTAIAEKGKNVSANLSANGLSTENVHVLFVAYKAENRLELYARKKTDSIYKRIAIYNICAASGRLGPKRGEGDGQVPEGFYHIDRFNPVSNFYLSLGINYPNRSDSRKSSAKRLGGDIFIHGSCVTIGCLPMTNDKIKEIYLYAAYS
ncbi:MAG: L,D-transpeptidase family protein, partial [Tannerella sp.]|nr:L,D-transpeptidase family protein [Tannerella sp.]